MENDSWPKICLKDEIKPGENEAASKWVVRSKQRWRDGIWGELVLIRQRGKGISKRKFRKWGNNWDKIEKSNYCKGYKEWKTEMKCERY